MTNTDFPAGALSNFRVVDSFSVVHWRLYAPVFYRSNAPMRNASDLQDTILKLRHADILAAPASDIFAIWMFCHDEKFSELESGKDDSDHEVEDGAFVIAKREYIGNITRTLYQVSQSPTEADLETVLIAGSLALSDLLSNLAIQGRAPLPFQYVHTLDGENQDSCANFLKDQVTYNAFEIALRSAVLSSLSLRLSEGQQYIPLGVQTLFSSIGLEENSLYPDKPLSINPFLAKLNVDFTTSGKLLLSCQNAPQPGIEQLHPHESEGIMRIDDNEEVWLAPMGIQGKFVGRYKSSSLFPNNQEYPEIWKKVVVDWLDKFHLQMDPDERKLWIEVEIGTKDIPYFDESTILPSSDEEFVRILWPARYSFHRPRQRYDDFVEEFRHFVEGAEGPLEFAARWMREAPMRAEQVRIAKEKEAAEKAQQAAQSKDDLHDIELPESLGAPLPFAEALLGPGGMYPTPPDAPQPTSTSASVTATHAVATVPPVLDPTLGNSQVMPRHTSLPEEPAWNLPTLPSAIQDAELGPFFSDMVTADDDPYSIPLPAGYDARQWYDLDISLPPGHVEPPDGLFGGMIPGAGIDLNFDFDFNNSFLPNLPDIAFPPITDMPHMPEPMDNSSVGLQSIGPLNPDGSADVAPAPAEHFQSQGHSFTMAAQFSQATVNNEPQKSPPTTSVPFDSSAFGQNRNSAPRLISLDALNSQAIQTSNAPKIDINSTPNCNTRQGISSNPAALSQSISNPIIGLGKGPTSTPRSPEDDESSEGPIGDHGYDDNAHTRKRRWSPAAENNVDVERTSDVPNAYAAEAARRQYTDLVGALVGSPRERSFQGAFTMQRSTLPVFNEAEDDIELAQLIVEVTTQSCFCHTGTAFSDLSDSRRQRLIASKIFTPFSPEVKSHVPDMKELAGLGNVREQLTLKPAATPPPFTCFSQPYIKVRREGQRLEALAAISSFWDTFELEPFYGAKDVKAICIYPEIAVNETREFFALMKQVYEGNSFGKHEDLLMIPWRYREDQAETPYLGIMEALLSHCIGIAPRVPRNDENVVIYIFNAFTSNGAISDICHCFLRLRKEYCSLLGTAATPISGDNIVLQIVPLDFIFNPLSLVVPPREDLQHLSMEIYSRCPPQPKTDFPKSFPIYLSIKWMTPVNIRCTPQATPPFVNTQSLLHVAYSQSADLRWVTAAWTDYQGHYQATVSFCLRKEGSTEFVSPRDVRQHIWMITMDIMQAAKLDSRVIITKDGPYDGAELGDWCSLIDNYNRSISKKVEVNFIAVDICPGLHAKVPSPPRTSSGVSSSTTNQGSAPSPGHKPASSTNQAEGDGHTELPSTSTAEPPKPPKQLSQLRAYDKLDQAWAVLLSHKPNFTSELSRYSSVKASGYLVYPDALNDNEGQAVLVAHVIHPPRRSAEVLLLRILQSFRQLATLSKVRGLNSSQHGHPLPWHIATAIRGQEVLSQTL